MKSNTRFPKDFQSLYNFVRESTLGADSVVFQAGHFLLIHDEQKNTIYPCIHAKGTTSHQMDRCDTHGRFPILTWKLALRLLAKLNIPQKHIMVVVNDWQYLPKGVDRSTFYAANNDLPESYLEAMSKYVDSILILEPKPVKKSVSTAPFFGEMNLRNRYHRHMSKLIASGNLPPNAKVNKKNGAVSCLFPDLSGGIQEAYCSDKSGDCTGEIAEMIYEANKMTGATSFVNLYPLVCKDFVELGSARAVQLFGASVKSILNIGFPSAGVQDEEDLILGSEATIQLFD